MGWSIKELFFVAGWRLSFLFWTLILLNVCFDHDVTYYFLCGGSVGGCVYDRQYSISDLESANAETVAVTTLETQFLSFCGQRTRILGLVSYMTTRTLQSEAEYRYRILVLLLVGDLTRPRSLSQSISGYPTKQGLRARQIGMIVRSHSNNVPAC